MKHSGITISIRARIRGQVHPNDASDNSILDHTPATNPLEVMDLIITARAPL